jgi:hypothetical protein
LLGIINFPDAQKQKSARPGRYVIYRNILAFSAPEASLTEFGPEKTKPGLGPGFAGTAKKGGI